MSHYAMKIQKIDLQLIPLMELQLDYQQGLFYTTMDQNPFFLFFKSPQLQYFLFVFYCSSLFIVLFLSFCMALTREHKEATTIVATKLLPPLPLPPNLQQNFHCHQHYFLFIQISLKNECAQIVKGRTLFCAHNFMKKPLFNTRPYNMHPRNQSVSPQKPYYYIIQVTP